MNRAHALASDARERRVLQALAIFFSAFAEGRLEVARRLCRPHFSWFGRAIEADGWSTPRARTFHQNAELSCAKPRSIPAAILAVLKARFDQEHLFEGPVTLREVVALVDVTVSGREVTVGAVVEDIEGEARIARVFDPTELRSALERL